MPFQLKRIQVALVKVEATEGTDAVPGTADAIRLIEPGAYSCNAEEENDRPDLHVQLLDEMGPIEPSAKYAEFSGKLHARGLNATYTTTSGPEMHALIQGAGMAAVFGASLWSYDTASTLTKSLTLYLWQGTDTGVHVLHKILGARLSRLNFSMAAGKPVTIEFTARGLYVAPTDTAVTAPTYIVSPTPRFLAANSWSLTSISTAVVREANFTIENTLKARLNANGTDGLTGYAITGRRATWGARFEAMRIADYNAFDKWVQATQEVLNIDVPGGAGTAFQRFKIDADKAVVQSAPTYEDDSGLYLYGLTGKLTPEGTNRAKITFD